MEDRHGTLWIGTEKGLNRYDPICDEFTHYLHDPTNPKSLSGNWISFLHEDRAGNLWVSTMEAGLNLFDRESGMFTHFKHDPADPRSISSNRISQFREDSFGNLWIGTLRGGLNRFDPRTQQFHHITIADLTN